MKKESAKREPSPIELWDQLAVNEIKKQLAPRGYKKVLGGKREVSNIQFLGKETVNTACVISANLIRLYRENLRERLEVGKVAYNQEVARLALNRADCQIWQFRKRRKIDDNISHMKGKIDALEDIAAEIDRLAPSVPKTARKAKQEPAQ